LAFFKAVFSFSEDPLSEDPFSGSEGREPVVLEFRFMSPRWSKGWRKTIVTGFAATGALFSGCCRE
jgi:hypothetical protein